MQMNLSIHEKTQNMLGCKQKALLTLADAHPNEDEASRRADFSVIINAT